MKDSFLKQYFARKGFTQVKPNHELDVLCPFLHANQHYDTRPSAHVNIKTGVFHCKTCAAEGRFSNGGLSEAGFISHLYGMSHSDAIQFLMMKDWNADGSYEKFASMLLGCDEKLDWLEARGITKKEVREYHLGYDGYGIVYPIYINGMMLDRRHYNTTREGDEAKVKSELNAKPLLFPFDHWQEQIDHSPFTLFCAGENDTILARKYGYNAITSTLGEGSFPQIFKNLFAGRKVIVCYDCDEAGRKAARNAAFYLKEAKADVSIMDLELEGTKDDKDITDFFIKRGYTHFDELIEKAIPFTEEDATEVKNEKFPLVDLWDVPEGRNSGKRLSTRAIMMGKFSNPMETPSAVETTCERYNDEDDTCRNCPFQKERTKWWTLDDDHLSDVLELVEVKKAEQQKNLKRFIGIPHDCPSPPRYVIRERKHVTKVVFTPDVDTENELTGFKGAEQHAYLVGLNLEDGGRYRLFFKRFAHPNDKQKIVMVVDQFEDSDNSINTFKMTPELLEDLKVFQKKPEVVMKERYELAKKVVGTFVNPMIVNIVNLTYHSPLQFKLYGKYTKTPFEVLLAGDTRTGKTETAQYLQLFYGLGNYTAVKNAKTTGLLGGVDKLPSGEYKISWGKIPLNHKGLIILDELSGVSTETMATLTDMRSEGVAVIEKIVKGKAPAKTRIIWTSNPRVNANGNSKGVSEYSNGVKIIMELIGSKEDIARFDLFYIVAKSGKLIPPRFDDEEILENMKKVNNTLYRQLIQWVWSRTPDQVKFEKGLDRYLWNVSVQLYEQYGCQYEFFGSETAKKLAKIAASTAAMCFSHDGTGENILVKKEHVDWAAQFMVDCYDNENFRLKEFVEQERKLTEITPEIVNEVAKIVKKHPVLIELLLEEDELQHYNLKVATNIGEDEYKYLMSTMTLNGLIKQTTKGISVTKRLKKSLDTLNMKMEERSFPSMIQPPSEPKSYSEEVTLD